MVVSTIIMLAAVGWLAFVNGANDNFKGVATLFASRTATYRTAIIWAMVSTLLGGFAAMVLGAELIRAFSGKGLVSATVLADSHFLLSVTLAAAVTVFLATRLGFPVSTTHAIIGGLVGAGLVAPGGVKLLLLGSKFVLPLLIAPLLAIALTGAFYLFLTNLRTRLGVKRETCLCVAEDTRAVVATAPAVQAQTGREGTLTTGLKLVVDDEEVCQQRYSGVIAGVQSEQIVNVLHFLTAGMVGFARGVQDTAKIAGLIVGAGIVSTADYGSLLPGIAMIVMCMALGGLVAARRVAETLGHKIADMNAGQGFTANLVTSLLVTGTALFGWGVSTTHCAVGALFGIGAVNGTAHWHMIRQIILAWLITLPVAAGLGCVLYLVL